MENLEGILETWFRRVWKKQDRDAIDEMFPSLSKVVGLGRQVMIGPEDFRQFHKSICSLISDIEITIDCSLEEGKWISALCTLHGRSSESGATVSMTGNVTVQIEDGKLLKSHDHWDFMGLWGQLGLLPNDSFEQGLSGKKVV